MDDITPIRQMTAAIAASDEPHLFAPRPAWRFRMKEPAQSQPEDPGAGHNPPYGASITYYLRSLPAGDVKITILDAAGKAVRSIDAPRDADAPEVDGKRPWKTGLVRVHWDLQHERSKEARLLTRPDEHSHVGIPDRGWRSMTEGGRVAPLAAPGTYTVRLEVGDRTYERPLEVRKDPRSAGTDAQVTDQVALLLRIRDEVNTVVDLIDEIESVRKQVGEVAGLVRGHDRTDEITKAARDLETKLKALENNLFDLRLTNARQDTLRWPRRLYAKLASLAGYIGGSDFPPTDQQIEVHELYTRQLAEYQDAMASLRSTDIASFNTLLRDAGVAGVIVRGGRE